MDGWEWFCAKWLPWISLPLFVLPFVLAWPLYVGFGQLANSSAAAGAVAFALLVPFAFALSVLEHILALLLFAGNLWGLVLLAHSQRSIVRVVQLAFGGINTLMFGGLTILWVLGGCHTRALLPR